MWLFYMHIRTTTKINERHALLRPLEKVKKLFSDASEKSGRK